MSDVATDATDSRRWTGRFPLFFGPWNGDRRASPGLDPPLRFPDADREAPFYLDPRPSWTRGAIVEPSFLLRMGPRWKLA